MKTAVREDGLWQIFRQMLDVAGAQKDQLKKMFWLAMLTAVLRGIAFVLFIPLFEVVLAHKGTQTIWLLGLVTALLFSSSLTDWFSRTYDFEGHAAKAGDSLRRRLGQHLRKIPLQSLYQSRSGELNATIAGNVDDVINYSMMMTLMVVNAVIVPMVAGLGAMWFDWRLGVALFVLFPLILPIYFLVKPILTKYQQRIATLNSTLSAETLEYTQGLAVLKSAGSIGMKSERFMQASNDVEQVQLDSLRATTPANVLLGSAVELGMAIVVGMGLWLLSEQSISLPLVVGLMVIVVRFAEPLGTFISMMNVVEMIQVGYSRLGKLQAIEPLPQITPAKIPTHYDVQFDDVTFQYDNSEQTSLKNLSISIPANALTALVGASGCGKTTLVRMLMRYADPQSGTVKIGGIDVREIEPEQLNKLVAIVFQDVYLFDDSILANVRMGRNSATDEEIIEACKTAHCHDFIERLPNGYQTRVGDIGSNLSGGEKQRISIARALLKDAPIIILDEPTASLDTQSELAVQRAIDALVENKTVIVIAHRLSTIVAAKQIMVMDEGNAAEVGTHEVLLKNNGRYARLWSAQHTME